MTAPLATGFEPGEGIAIVGPGTWMLVMEGGSPGLCEKAWVAAATDQPAADILAALFESSHARLPDFALVRLEGTQARVFARGQVMARVGEHVINGASATTWSEQLVPASGAITLFVGTEPQVPGSFHAVVGMFPARCLTLGLAPASTAPTSTAPSVPASEPGTAQPPTVGEPGRPAGYDQLFGATVHRSVEAAAVRVPVADSGHEHPDDDQAGPGHVETEGTAPVAEPASGDGSVTLLAEEDERGVTMDLDTSRTSTDHAAPPPTSTAPEESDPDESDSTIRRPYRSLSDLVASTPDEPNIGAGPVVQAKRCERGHLNAPYAHDCRVCGTAGFSADLTDVRRPPLGRLEFSSGESVPVDRPVIVGRSPSAQLRGTQVPALVTVRGADVSRSHVEVRLEDWTVLVIDLNSANGTMVTLPGKPAQRLRPNEPLQIAPGTLVTLADDVHFRFVVPQ